MKSLYGAAFFFFPQFISAIWPIPVSYIHGDKELWIREDVQIYYDLGTDSDSDVQDWVVFQSDDSNRVDDKTSPLTPKRMLDSNIHRALRTILDSDYSPWKFHERGWTDPSPSDNSTYITTLTLKQLQPNPENFEKALAGEVDESYTLRVSEEGAAMIEANSTIGLIRALTTFTQLFYQNPEQKDAYTQLAPVNIFDTPKFPHRGINIDVARQVIPLHLICHQIDAMAYNKMNRLHLHVTDSQSWPLEIPALPELAEKGAYRPTSTYSPDDFRNIQRYAALQGVEVITEIDMPGHTSSIWHSHPELIAAYNIQPDWDTYAAEPPSGTLKLNSKDVDAFLDTLFSDLMPRVSPYSSYFHTGGDEVNKQAYTLDDTVKSADPVVLQPLMQRFVDRNHDRVREAGLAPVVWEEMLLDWNLTLREDVVVQTWLADESVLKVVEKGHKALVGNYNYWYLDCGKGQWLDLPGSYSPFLDYCAPFHNWRHVYSYDPLTSIPLESQHLVLGGEVHIWGEQTDAVNLDRMLWPRAAAAAEVLWSGAKDEQGRNRSQTEASPRLGDMRERLVALGVGAEPLQMPYCTMNGTQCALGF
ncbi:hypothetical protein GQ43DRAFT_414460 [Delitschia confertaspora ATCC 74209]|uniref:Beta-hexosaminidase n=1 Tax=Delitschia confertaspora ATCC 74209 TaxID=1513339 RepID=A0A9P4JMA9_9PLEO|nr:hypothetical protein GQ43DRAFT_414460 [Delitschia confertaspora ATCC 74209]